MFTIKKSIFGDGTPVLCVPIIDNKRDSIVAKAVKLAENGVPMTEWRIDFCDELDNETAILDIAAEMYSKIGDMVLLITYRSKAEGGEGNANPAYIQSLYESLSRGKLCDFIDVEIYQNENVKEFIDKLHQNDVRVIASFHDFSSTPTNERLEGILDDMRAAKADILKLAVMPQNKSDVMRLMSVTFDYGEAHKDCQLATMSMGTLGAVSRVIGEFTGSCMTFGADGVSSAPGQIDKAKLDSMLTTIHQSMSASRPNIYLIGFMGCGKSRISYELGRMTGLEVVDTDEKLVEYFGMSIPEIFDKYSEDRFRLAETQLLAELAAEGGRIISCGGGVILKEINRINMKKSGLCIQLTARPETILARVGTDNNRPLLKGHMNVADIQKMLDAREEGYALARDIMVCTDKRKPFDIATEIKELMETK